MTKHEYICKITEVVASKSTCLRKKVGAVFITDDYEILSTGYNGAPRGFEHCNKKTCNEKMIGCNISVHAEQNAIVQSAKNGVKLKNSILYITMSPCENCSKLLINLGVKKVFFKEKYRDNGYSFLNKAKIEVFNWNNIKI